VLGEQIITRGLSMMEKDITEKTLESYNDVFADIINVFAFQGEQVVHAKELSDALPRSFYKADGKIRQQERDVAKYWRKHRIRIATFGIENQTEADADMPLRVIGYDGASYRAQIRKGQKSRYPVITIVLYFDYKKRWKKPLRLKDCFDIPEKLKLLVNDYKVHLLEVAWLTKEQVKLFRSDFKIVADYFVQMRENNDYVPSKETMQHVQEVLQLMAVLSGDERFEEVYQEEGSVTNMCEVLDRAERRGIAIGESRGIAIGESRGIIKGTVATLLRFGMENAQILEEIMKLFQLDEATALKYLEEVG
jgi:hypothetical protein